MSNATLDKTDRQTDRQTDITVQTNWLSTSVYVNKNQNVLKQYGNKSTSYP